MTISEKYNAVLCEIKKLAALINETSSECENCLLSANNLSDLEDLSAAQEQLGINEKADINTPVFTGNITTPVLIGTGSVPLVVYGTGAGTGPTATSIIGSSLAFRLTWTTGSGPAGSSSTIATITYATPFPNGSIVIIRGTNQNAAQLSGVTQIKGIGSAVNLIIQSGISALSSTTTYQIDILIIGF